MFEHMIDALFRAHGYSTQTNSIIHGRSGARHEIDVLAERAEGLLAARIGVECKNWAQPIDTAVVARARLVRDDLGLGQMIIACPSGATPAARTTASEMGIEIWERADLDARLGAAAIDALAPAPPSTHRRGVQRTITSAHARQLIFRTTRSRLGFGKADIRWVGDIWITMYEVRFGCATRTGMRQRLHTRPAYSRYESLGGGGVWSGTRPTEVAMIGTDAAPTLSPLVTAQQLRTEIERLLLRREDLVQDTARTRHLEICADRCIPDAEHVTCDEITAFEWPLTLAVVEERRGTRVVVVDAVGGRVDIELSELLTGQLGRLTQTLGIPGSNRTARVG
jgi:hypothetical protein